jgi:hypothetical protein
MANAPKALGIDANTTNDVVTQDFFNYREAHVYPHLLSKGIALEKLQGSHAIRAEVKPKAEPADLQLITASGHGDPSTFLGNRPEPVFKVGEYTSREMAGKIIHMLSCRTAMSLGLDVVNKGCRAYFGYAVDFLYPTGLKDIFFECDSEIDRAFADRCTAAVVFARVQQLVKLRADELLASGSDLDRCGAAALQVLFEELRCPSSPAAPNGYGAESAKLT